LGYSTTAPSRILLGDDGRPNRPRPKHYWPSRDIFAWQFVAKGVATALGLPLLAQGHLAAVAVFLLVVVAFRYVALGSMVAVAAVPVLAFLMRPASSSPAALAATCATAVLIVARHHENLRRLFAGSEPRFEWRRT
jgi:glycerol-3-phosphate acyltransferase PlsY